MRKLILSLLLLSSPVLAMQRLSGWCEQGAKVVVAPAVVGQPPLTRSFQQSYPRCTVTVFVTGGGGTLASVFSTNSPNPVALPNPFQATTLGYWDFYATNGHYDVQISGGGLPTPFTFGDNDLFDIADYSPCPGCTLSATGFISTGGKYDDYSSQTGGLLLRGANIAQTSAGLSGGYIKLSPLTYNPNDGPPVFDIYGNPVRDPVYLPGDSLGSHDAVLFVGEATDLIPNPDLVMGLFTNVYVFSRVGFATDYASEASFQSLNGGMQALSFAAVNYVNSGQHAGTPPPLTNLDQFHPGAIFYDTLAGCEKVYSGSTWSCLGGGGGGGGTNPAGPSGAVQFNNSSVFGGTVDMTYDTVTKLFNVNASDVLHAGINVHTGFIQADAGFVVGVGLTYNSVQTAGGMGAGSFTAGKYVQTGHGPTTPFASLGDAFHAGALYYDDSNHCEAVFNGSAWSCLGAGGSTSPGPPANSVQYNSGGVFSGNGKFVWDPGQFLNIIAPSVISPGINVQVGFVQSATGFVAVPGTATTYNAIQAIGGGMAANSFTAQSYIQSGNSSGIPSVTLSDSFHPGALYYDTTLNTERVFNGSTWVNIGSGGGGGGAASPDRSVQFNAGGTSFGGTVNFQWLDTTGTGGYCCFLNINAPLGQAGINVQNGFIQSDIGITVVNGGSYNSIQSVFGGVRAISIDATRYIQTGFGVNTPGSLLNPLVSGDSLQRGTMFFNTAVGQEQVYNGTTWISLGGTGGGSPGGPNNAIQFNSSSSFGGSANLTYDGISLSALGNMTVTASSATFTQAAFFSGLSNDGSAGAVFRGTININNGGATPNQTNFNSGVTLNMNNGSTLNLATGMAITVGTGTVQNGTISCALAPHQAVQAITFYQGLVTGVTCF